MHKNRNYKVKITKKKNVKIFHYFFFFICHGGCTKSNHCNFYFEVQYVNEHSPLLHGHRRLGLFDHLISWQYWLQTECAIFSHLNICLFDFCPYSFIEGVLHLYLPCNSGSIKQLAGLCYYNIFHFPQSQEMKFSFEFFWLLSIFFQKLWNKNWSWCLTWMFRSLLSQRYQQKKSF